MANPGDELQDFTENLERDLQGKLQDVNPKEFVQPPVTEFDKLRKRVNYLTR